MQIFWQLFLSKMKVFCKKIRTIFTDNTDSFSHLNSSNYKRLIPKLKFHTANIRITFRF